MESERDIYHLMVLLDTALEKEHGKWLPSCYSNEENKQNLVTVSERKEIVLWLMDLCSKFSFLDETLFLAVAIMDKFLKVVKAQPKYLRCIGVTCLYIAAKTVEEDDVLPSTRELIHASECSCSMREICRMECCILNQLKWDVNLATPLQFLQLFYALLAKKFRNVPIGCHLSARHLHVMTKLLQNSLLHHQLLHYSPSVLGLSLLSLQLRMVWPYWRACVGHLQAIIQADETDLEKCCLVLSALASEALRMSVHVPMKKSLSSRKSVPKHYQQLRKQKSHPYQLQRSLHGSLRHRAEMSDDEDEEDMYDGVKKLYDEDSNCSSDASNMGCYDGGKQQHQLFTNFGSLSSFLGSNRRLL